jgi:hypothetical protein
MSRARIAAAGCVAAAALLVLVCAQQPAPVQAVAERRLQQTTPVYKVSLFKFNEEAAVPLCASGKCVCPHTWRQASTTTHSWCRPAPPPSPTITTGTLALPGVPVCYVPVNSAVTVSIIITDGTDCSNTQALTDKGDAICAVLLASPSSPYKSCDHVITGCSSGRRKLHVSRACTTTVHSGPYLDPSEEGSKASFDP